jgi:hypothetical protein
MQHMLTLLPFMPVYAARIMEGMGKITSIAVISSDPHDYLLHLNMLGCNCAPSRQWSTNHASAMNMAHNAPYTAQSCSCKRSGSVVYLHQLATTIPCMRRVPVVPLPINLTSRLGYTFPVSVFCKLLHC